jgi:cobalamin biosynthesis protein CobT
VSFATKIWGKTKEFTADIETQWPNERIKWSVSQGMTHTGVVTFHELAPNLTRVLLSFDVEPGSLIEKAARGMRHVKRAARADLHRFKALIEMAGLETGAWRGRIEDGEVVEEHDPSYDEQREYSDVEDLVEASDEEDEDEEEGDEEDEDEQGRDDEEADAEEPKAERSRRRRHSRNGSQEDDRDEEPAARRTRNQSRASSANRASRSRGSSGSGSGSSGSRSRSSRGSGGAQASGRRTRSRSSNS